MPSITLRSLHWSPQHCTPSEISPRTSSVHCARGATSPELDSILLAARACPPPPTVPLCHRAAEPLRHSAVHLRGWATLCAHLSCCPHPASPPALPIFAEACQILFHKNKMLQVRYSLDELALLYERSCVGVYMFWACLDLFLLLFGYQKSWGFSNAGGGIRQREGVWARAARQHCSRRWRGLGVARFGRERDKEQLKLFFYALLHTMFYLLSWIVSGIPRHLYMIV